MRTRLPAFRGFPMIGTNGTKSTKVTGLRCLLGLLGVAVSFLAVGSSFAQTNANRILVANVYFVGTRTIPTDKAMQYVYTKPGNEYTYAQVQDDVSRLAASRLFKYIRVRTDSTTDGRI